jgi:peptide/nickel transport system permease protein
VLVTVAVIAYGGLRLLRPDYYPGENFFAGLRGELERAFLHLDFGEACMYTGCPPIRELWVAGIGADLWLLAGAAVLGIAGGLLGGTYVTTHPRSVGALALEWLAMLAFCTPVYVAGYGILILFAPPFGLEPLPVLFEPHVYQPPWDAPWDWARSLLLPWLIVAAPLGAVVLRLTVALTRDAMHEDYVRTGIAKGLPYPRVVRRHAGPAAYPTVAAYVGAATPLLVTNMVLVEYVFSVPGFFRHMKRALGQSPGYSPVPDVTVLQALALWAAVLIVVGGVLADLALARLDPRVRAGGRPG